MPAPRGASRAVKIDAWAAAVTREGSPDAFEKLFRAEYPRVVAVAHRILAGGQEAEDVAQEVFWSFHRRHPAGASYAAAWLHRAAAHAALNVLRGERRRRRRELAQEEPAPVADPELEVVEAERRRAVRRALAGLPEPAATVLALRYSGLSYAEVAAAMGVGIGQVGTRLRRAEAALRKEMEHATPA